MSRLPDNDAGQQKDQAARELAQKHREVDGGITHVLRFRDRVEVERLPTDPIKLLMVNTNTAPSGVMPLQFCAEPALGVPFPIVIIEVTPNEFERIQAKELQLPGGWLDSYEISSESESVRK